MRDTAGRSHELRSSHVRGTPRTGLGTEVLQRVLVVRGLDVYANANVTVERVSQ